MDSSRVGRRGLMVEILFIVVAQCLRVSCSHYADPAGLIHMASRYAKKLKLLPSLD
ncbi:MAG: hypothetical protein ACKO35_14185 [Planctomycetaceae bacterium]